MNKLDKILEQFSDYGHHDNNGYGDCPTCKKVAKAKQAIQQELLKARLDELQKLLFTSQFGVPDGWEATNVLVKDIKRCIAELQASLKDGENQLGEKS